MPTFALAAQVAIPPSTQLLPAAAHSVWRPSGARSQQGKTYWESCVNTWCSHRTLLPMNWGQMLVSGNSRVGCSCRGYSWAPGHWVWEAWLIKLEAAVREERMNFHLMLSKWQRWHMCSGPQMSEETDTRYVCFAELPGSCRKVTGTPGPPHMSRSLCLPITIKGKLRTILVEPSHSVISFFKKIRKANYMFSFRWGSHRGRQWCEQPASPCRRLFPQSFTAVDSVTVKSSWKFCGILKSSHRICSDLQHCGGQKKAGWGRRHWARLEFC